MARSNGPQTPPGAGRTQRPDPQNWAQGTPPRPAAPRPAQAQPVAGSYPPQSAGAAYQQAAYGSAAQGQPTYPQQPQNYPAQTPQGYASPNPNYGSSQQAYPAQPQQGYAPQSQAYSSLANSGLQNDPRYGAEAARAPAAASPSGRSSAFDALLAQEPTSTGFAGAGAYGTPNARSSPYPSSGGQPAPAGYSQSDYGRQAASAQSDAGNSGHWPQDADFGAASLGHSGHYGADGQNAPGGYEEWAHADAYGAHGQEPGFDTGYGAEAQDYGQGEHGNGLYAEDDDFEDEPRQRSKLPLIAAAVLGALICGGGLAYGYKALLAPVDGSTPLVKNEVSPSKFKPDDPGGRKFAHSGNKIMSGPLGDGEAAPGQGSDPAAVTSDAGAKKVQTVEIRPDGSMVRSSGDSEPPASASSQSTSSIEIGPSSSQSFDFPSAGNTGAEASPAASAPSVISKAPEPPPAPPAATEPALDEPPPVATPKKVAAKKVAPSDAPSTPVTGAGWVAVLASVPVSGSSQMDSLKQFADMQQRYGDVLGDKTPSVQEANLGEKGRYHRLVVGPPGSRDSANSVCGGLKSQGYGGCWVMQY